MGVQFIGWVLLIAMLSAGIYVATHYSELANFKIKLPIKISPVYPPLVGSKTDGAKNNSGGPDLSWYPVTERKLARISYVRRPTQFEPFLDIVLSSGLSNGEKLDITGWMLKPNKGGVLVIPKAQGVYSFGGSQEDIYISAGDQVHLYSGRGIKGNFRLNKCMGYLEAEPPIVPPIPKECPSANRSEISNFSGACQDYILSLRTCENPTANPPVPISEDSCHAFLSKMNYDGCVKKYRNSADFLSREWRVWIEEQGNIFDSIHDKIQLIDSQGKIVDEFVY